MFPDALGFLRLLQLADSALPIGAAAHSFGLETLAAEGVLDTEQLPDFLRAWLEETGTLESTWCLQAAVILDVARWIDLNRTIAATKPARESRAASAVLGRRFLELAAELTGHALLAEFARAACDMHLATAFRAAGDPFDAAACFVPAIEIASMRHPWLSTRLFVS